MEWEVEECPELLANGAKVVVGQGIEVEHVEKVLYFDEREMMIGYQGMKRGSQRWI
jgi:hypothetical protein